MPEEVRSSHSLVLIPVPGIRYRYTMVPFSILESFCNNKKSHFSSNQWNHSVVDHISYIYVRFAATKQITSQSVCLSVVSLAFCCAADESGFIPAHHCVIRINIINNTNMYMCSQSALISLSQEHRKYCTCLQIGARISFYVQYVNWNLWLVNIFTTVAVDGR